MCAYLLCRLYASRYSDSRSSAVVNGTGPLFKKAVADSNAPCQEKALDALIAYLRAADTDAARHVFLPPLLSRFSLTELCRFVLIISLVVSNF